MVAYKPSPSTQEAEPDRALNLKPGSTQHNESQSQKNNKKFHTDRHFLIFNFLIFLILIF